MNFFNHNPCNPSGHDTFQFDIFLRCMEISSRVMLILSCFVTHFNLFSTIIIHSIFLLWLTGLSHNSLQNLINFSVSEIICSSLIFSPNSSYEPFKSFLKILFYWYCFTLDLLRFNFNVLTEIRWFSSSTTVLKHLGFILFLFFSSNFNLKLPFFHRPFNQLPILPKYFLKYAISFSVLW